MRLKGRGREKQKRRGNEVFFSGASLVGEFALFVSESHGICSPPSRQANWLFQINALNSLIGLYSLARRIISLMVTYTVLIVEFNLGGSIFPSIPDD